MTLYEIAALLSRHVVAVAIILLLAGVAGYGIVTTPPVYSESGGIVFTASGKPARLALSGDQSALIGQSLITTEATVAAAMGSPRVSARVRGAGGTAQFTVTPDNMYNLQYPDYALPIETLVASSPSPAATHRTFWLVFRLVQQRLAVSQARAGAAVRNRIRVYVVADTGPELAAGSRSRAIGGLGALTVVAVLVLAGVLDRRRRPSGRRRADRGHGRRPGAVMPVTTGADR